MEEAVEPSEHGLSPGVLGLIAVLSIGGLLFVGWQASVAGQYVAGPYATRGPFAACCTVEPWGSSQAGFRLGTGLVSSEDCQAFEDPTRCCVRGTRDRYHSPVRLLNAHAGICSAPEVSYPFAVGAQFSVCCTIETYRSAPTGSIQGGTETTTERCSAPEGPKDCCARAGATRSPFKIRVLGARAGDCNPPEVSYPAPIPGGYTACCYASTWLNSPIGYTQGTSKQTRGSCDRLEALSQCCARTVAQVSEYPMKLLGFKMGSCDTPEISYPMGIRYPS